MKKKVVLAAVAAAGISAPAFAQDEDQWSGGIQPYVGVIGGWDHVRASSGGFSDSRSGVVYGGVVGAQAKVGGNGVIGIEGEIDGASTKYEESGVITGIGAVTAKIKSGRDLFIGARAGLVPTRNTLLYVKGGYTNARFSASATDGVDTISASENFSGYRVGGGVEYSMHRWRARLEYRFSDYGNLKYQGFDLETSGQRHQIVAGLLYAF